MSGFQSWSVSEVMNHQDAITMAQLSGATSDAQPMELLNIEHQRSLLVGKVSFAIDVAGLANSGVLYQREYINRALSVIDGYVQRLGRSNKIATI